MMLDVNDKTALVFSRYEDVWGSEDKISRILNLDGSEPHLHVPSDFPLRKQPHVSIGYDFGS
jgi:hypothetical protein